MHEPDRMALPTTQTDSWDWMPARSQLYSLEPYGGGNVQRESLVSYIVRLARAHSLNPRHLIRFVFAKVEIAFEKICDHTFFSKAVGTANGLGKYAALLSATANTLTCRRDLASLTLLPWSELIPAQSEGLLAPHPRWCPYCLAEQAARFGETYSPLVWSLSLYGRCIHHSCALLDRCFRCGRFQDFLPTYPDVSRCSHCGSSLAENAATEPQILGPEIGVVPSGHVEYIIVDMVSRPLEAVATSRRENFRRSLKLLANEFAGGNLAAFCRALGWDMWALNGWLKRDEKISLPKLLQLAHHFAVSPIELCGPAFDPSILNQIENGCCTGGLCSRGRKPLLRQRELEGLSKAIETILNGAGPLPSLRQLGSELGLSRSALKYWFPEACANICETRRRHRIGLTAAAEAARLEILEHEVQALLAIGTFPTRRKVDARLRVHGLALARPDLFAAYRSLMEALANNS